MIPEDQLVARLATTWASDRRRMRAWEMWSIYREDLAPLVEEAIRAQYHDDEARRELRRFAAREWNVLLDVTRVGAVAYRSGVSRRVHGATPHQQAAFAALVQEGRAAIHCPQWLRLAFALGPVTVIPVVRASKLRWDVLLPHYTEADPDENDYAGPPSAVAYTVQDSSTAAGTTVYVDGTHWSYWSTTNGTLDRTRSVAHGAGRMPGSTLRLDTPYDADWWTSSRNERLRAATITVAVIATALAFVRKTQNRKLLTIIGNITATQMQQRIDPEIPLQLKTKMGPSAIDVDAVDLETTPDGFLKHIAAVYRTAAEGLGIPSFAVDFDFESGSESERLRVQHEALTELRGEQVPHCREFESRLWAEAVRECKATGHPRAPDLPDPDVVESTLEVEFPLLSRAYNDPTAERDHLDWQMRRGVIAPLDLLRRDHPSLSDVELAAEQTQNLAAYAAYVQTITRVGGVVDETGSVTTPNAAAGVLGPMVRDADKDQGEEVGGP